jgi:hypothetical protein
MRRRSLVWIIGFGTEGRWLRASAVGRESPPPAEAREEPEDLARTQVSF